MQTKTDIPLLIPSAIKFLRRVWLLMFASILVFAAVAEASAPPSRHPPNSFPESIAAVAVLCAVGWTVFRRKYVGEGLRQLDRDPNDPRALQRWRTGHIISFALSEAVALYGLNLRYAGLSFRGVAAFYIAGLILMIFSLPRVPIETHEA